MKKHKDWKKLCPTLLDIKYKKNGRTKVFIDCPAKKSFNCKGKRWITVASMVKNANEKNILFGLCNACSVWKGGIDEYGYCNIYVKGKKFKEHRYIMEQYLGRELKENEEVHHRNGNRADNKISNLRVILLSKHHAGIAETDAVDWLKSLGYCVQKPCQSQ